MHCAVGGMLVSGTLVEMLVDRTLVWISRQGWRLSWKVKVHWVGLTGVQRAKATGTEDNLGGTVGIHSVHSASRMAVANLCQGV